MRIYNKLVIIFLTFVIIPVIFVSNLLFYNSKNIIEKEIFSKLNIINDEEKGEIERFLHERRQDLLLLEHSNIIIKTFSVLDQFCKDRSNPSYMEAKKEVDRIYYELQLEHDYLDVILINMDGKVIYVFDPVFASQTGTILQNKDDIFQQSKAGIYVGNIHKTINKQYPNFMFLTGLVYGKANKVIGFLCLELDMVKWFKFIQDDSELGESLEIIIAKKMPDNTVMFLSPLKYQQKTINIGSEYGLPAQKSVLGETGSGLTIDYRGKEVLSAWSPIKDLEWGLISKIDSDEAFLPIEKLKKLLIVIILITIFSSALAVFTIAKSISDPIQELQKGTAIIGKGNLDYKIGNDSRDEIGQLSRAFDKMTKNLKETTTSIDTLNKEIAERKNIEEELDIFSKAIESANDSFVLADMNGNVTYANKSAIETFGYSPEEIMKLNVGQFDINPEVVAKIIGKTIAEGKWNGESISIKKNKETFSVILSISFIKDKKGNPRGMMGIFRDISESKKAEEKLSQAFKEEIKSREILLSMLADNNQIRQKLEENIEKLKRAQDMMILSEKMASLGRLISEIAHEFNNPLMVISGNAQISLMSEPLSDEVKNNLQIIMEESLRAKNIIRRLLKFSRPSRGEVNEVDINKSIDAIANILEQQFKLVNVEIKRDYQENLSLIPIDEQQLQEVFMNLLNNAKDAMPDGGAITIKTSRDKDYLQIDFKDTGMGMSEEVKSKIFDPFFTTKKEGTGLGLVVCFGIIEAHKGEFRFESELNKGTTFTIRLPLV